MGAKQTNRILTAIQKISATPGDVVFLKVPDDRNGQMAAAMLRRLESRLPEGVMFLVVPSEWTLVQMKAAISEEVAEAKTAPASLRTCDPSAGPRLILPGH